MDGTTPVRPESGDTLTRLFDRVSELDRLIETDMDDDARNSLVCDVNALRRRIAEAPAATLSDLLVKARTLAGLKQACGSYNTSFTELLVCGIAEGIENLTRQPGGNGPSDFWRLYFHIRSLDDYDPRVEPLCEQQIEAVYAGLRSEARTVEECNHRIDMLILQLAHLCVGWDDHRKELENCRRVAAAASTKVLPSSAPLMPSEASDLRRIAFEMEPLIGDIRACFENLDCLHDASGDPALYPLIKIMEPALNSLNAHWEHLFSIAVKKEGVSDPVIGLAGLLDAAENNWPDEGQDPAGFSSAEAFHESLKAKLVETPATTLDGIAAKLRYILKVDRIEPADADMIRSAMRDLGATDIPDNDEEPEAVAA